MARWLAERPKAFKDIAQWIQEVRGVVEAV